ncbi:MAG: glycoside hydrolase family 2 protein [Bacteroidales bacterium]|nr:glycoside hydrolase family 2 protein [Bacteroidales bacterium]
MTLKKFIIPILASLAVAPCAYAGRSETLLKKGWRFSQEDTPQAALTDFDDSRWQEVNVPHDWAIYGPFDRKYDLQTVAVTQDGETKATLKTGRSGGLPYMGTGWYRTTFDAAPGRMVSLVFDGAMSEARVWVNGKEVGEWPFGYNSFHFDVTPYLNTDGSANTLAVRLENKPFSSRWYPGAGLYRNVRVVETDSIHIPVWGTHITTPHVADDFATVNLRVKIENVGDREVSVETDILSPEGKVVASRTTAGRVNHGLPVEQNFEIDAPALWSPESPSLYVARTVVKDAAGKVLDNYDTRFGVRSIEIIPERGFFLNGKPRKFQGVCNHHDLGPLGAAVNTSALRHQLELLKDMGCDAVRTSHNMPAPELVSLCDEMGLMMMIEPFDEWDIAKCQNGYHRFFDQWAERDMVNMLHQYRNHPAVVMWSIGNEVPTQCSPEGYKVAKFLQDICHREDPTRPVTCGMDQVSCVLDNGFGAMIDVPGLNYRTHRYVESYEKLPQGIILGSETASTVSSRGVYKFPVEVSGTAMYPDHQSSGYDTEHCAWANIPDVDFALAEDYPWTMGQFVWTGFDYLGEPSPYNTDAWPSHSSLFGIIDLASIPKDRYYLYRSHWNRADTTLHIVPHWTWPGREGHTTPVVVYSSFPEAELWINGVSQGRQRLMTAAEAAVSSDDMALLRRYRLMWMDAVYQPGEIRVVAYDENGQPAAERTVRTAGKPYSLKLETSTDALESNGEDLAYVTVSVVDRDGNLCPSDDRLVKFRVGGQGKYRAAANGDATSLDLFHLPQMHMFNGRLTAIVQSSETPGILTLTASAPGLKSASISIPVK